MFSSLNLNNKGFTLLEIVLAIAVASIIGITFFGFFANSARVIKSTDVREKALMLAQQEMEFFKAAGFKEITESILPENYDFNNGNNNKWVSNSDYEEIPASDGFPKYNIKIEVEELEEDSLYKLIVTSSWNVNSTDKFLSLTSYVASRGDE